jgi:anti-anti-sigma factor|tara:strand:- start:5270 stop:5758 length:489 start_codon:yes stop_codon:yes gene_type:complete
MQPGQILVASHEGAYLIKLIGDVRVSLCGSFDQYIESILSADNFISVIIDLTEADGIDSTSLGMLAKISIEARSRFNLTPVIVSNCESINRLIVSMGFDSVFDIRDKAPACINELSELPHISCSEEGMREKVLNAHKVLMGLCEENEAKFKELVNVLEQNSN